MPVVDVENNIIELTKKIEQLMGEVFRHKGMLETFQGFRRGGLKTIELPIDPYQDSDIDSIQEKPE